MRAGYFPRPDDNEMVYLREPISGLKDSLIQNTQEYKHSGEHIVDIEHLTENYGLVLSEAKFDVVIIGAGSGGIATASSLRKRNKKLRIALIDPSSEHYY